MSFFIAGAAHAASYAVQDAGADAQGICQNAWPPGVVGNYNEAGTVNGAPYYQGNGWFLYQATMITGPSWILGTSLGQSDINAGSVYHYAASASATPPTGAVYQRAPNGCGRVNVQADAVVPAPSAPTMSPLNAGVAPYISSGSTNVAWSAVAGVVGYKLDVATDPGFTVFHPGYNALVVTASPTPPTSVTVTGLSNAGTTYYFRVRAYNSGGDSANSATVSSTTVPATPALQAPTTLRAQQFTAHWSASTGATLHRLQVCTDVNFTSCLPGYNPATVGDSPSALVSGLSQNTTYHYRVAAGNDNGYSAYSTGAAVTTNALPALGGTFTTSGAVNDNATTAPFSGVTVSDANGDPITIAITYTAANGTLSGAGLAGSAGSYTLTAATPAAATTALQAVVFHPTYAQGPSGSTVTTTFTLQPNDGTDAGTANSATVVTTTMTNAVPVFIGAANSVTVNGNSGANNVSALLHVSDPDAGQTITWSIQSAPSHGTVQMTGATAASGGSDIAPAGTISYTPAPGYGGSDSFAIQASDSFGAAVRTIAVTVLPVAPGAPTIGTATPGAGQATVSFTAPANNGGAAITGYTVTSQPHAITAGGNGFTTSPITVTGLTNGTSYTFTVTATNGVGTGAPSAASNAVVPKGNQTITFANPGAQNFGTTPTLSATAASGLPVTFTSSTAGVCTITPGGVLTFVASGACTIDADQSGNGAWNAAGTVTNTFPVQAIAPGAPVIGAATAGDAGATVTFTPPASTGGSPITGYTVTSTPAGGTGTGAASPINVTGLTNGTLYTFTVTATNSVGPGPASAASNAVTPKAAQTITFANPGAQTFGTNPDLAVLNGGASATSGLPVTFTAATPGVCTVTSAGVLTFVTVGTCTVHADQIGNGTFLAAAQVSRSFTVNAIVPGAPTSVVATAGDTQASVAFVAPVNTGGSAITSYTVTVSPADVAPVLGAGSPVVVTGLTNGQAYTFTVAADNVAGTGPDSSSSNSITPKASQTIAFSNPGAQNFGTSPTLTATTDSGLTPTFTSSTPSVCTITPSGALTFLTAGSCTINADQPGNGAYLAATQVTRTFAVTALLSVSGPVPGMVGTGTAVLSGGGANCTLNPGVTGFMTPATAPTQRTLPHGGFAFLATGCTGSVTLTLVYPEPLPTAVQFWKFGPATGGAPTSTWFAWPGATLSADRLTVSYTVADNGAGDANAATGSIQDPFAPALAAAGAIGVPVNNPWALAALAALLAGIGVRRRARVA